MAGIEARSSSETTDTTASRRRNSPLLSHSRAFGSLFPTGDSDIAAQNADDRFFVPSYLEGSTYVRKLAEAHRMRLQAQADAKRSTAMRPTVNLPSSNTLPPGSHRGMSHSVIERPPQPDTEDGLAPLPTRWNREDMWGGIEVQGDGRDVKYTGPRNHHERDHEACAVRADHYMPPQCGIYYYEVLILSSKRDE
jgi:Ran-binding protein 9/10